MNDRVTQLIAAAEKHIESKHYSVALQQLAAAEQIEPDNKSIQMIKELVKSLQAEKAKPTMLNWLLSVTVDPKSPTGIKHDQASPHDDVHKRVRSLTSNAEYFLSRGAVDNAFESLMRAYLLDPLAPEVIACEQRVLPEWQKVHGYSVKEAKHEWSLNVGPSQRAKTPSALFERLKRGKLFG